MRRSWPPTSLVPAHLLSPSPRRGSPTARSEQLPARAQETRALHQGAAEGVRKGVCSQQVHHQREAPAHLSHHEPLGAPGHHLVPEPAGEREEGGQQIESASSPLHLTVHPPAPSIYVLCRRFVRNPPEGRCTGADHYLILPRKRNSTPALCLTLLPTPSLLSTPSRQHSLSIHSWGGGFG